jgi:hypothetical protein
MTSSLYHDIPVQPDECLVCREGLILRRETEARISAYKDVEAFAEASVSLAQLIRERFSVG